MRTFLFDTRKGHHAAHIRTAGGKHTHNTHTHANMWHSTQQTIACLRIFLFFVEKIIKLVYLILLVKKLYTLRIFGQVLYISALNWYGSSVDWLIALRSLNAISLIIVFNAPWMFAKDVVILSFIYIFKTLPDAFGSLWRFSTTTTIQI